MIISGSHLILQRKNPPLTSRDFLFHVVLSTPFSYFSSQHRQLLICPAQANQQCLFSLFFLFFFFFSFFRSTQSVSCILCLVPRENSNQCGTAKNKNKNCNVFEKPRKIARRRKKNKPCKEKMDAISNLNLYCSSKLPISASICCCTTV